MLTCNERWKAQAPVGEPGQKSDGGLGSGRGGVEGSHAVRRREVASRSPATGRLEVREKGRAVALISLNSRRFVDITDDVRIRIRAGYTRNLDAWTDAVLSASSPEDVFRNADHLRAAPRGQHGASPGATDLLACSASGSIPGDADSRTHSGEFGRSAARCPVRRCGRSDTGASPGAINDTHLTPV